MPTTPTAVRRAATRAAGGAILKIPGRVVAELVAIRERDGRTLAAVLLDLVARGARLAVPRRPCATRPRELQVPAAALADVRRWLRDQPRAPRRGGQLDPIVAGLATILDCASDELPDRVRQLLADLDRLQAREAELVGRLAGASELISGGTTALIEDHRSWMAQRADLEEVVRRLAAERDQLEALHREMTAERDRYAADLSALMGACP